MLWFKRWIKNVRLSILQVELNYRYPKYHNFSNRLIFDDMLELSGSIRTLIGHAASALDELALYRLYVADRISP